MQAHSEVSRAVCAVWNLLQQQFIKLRVRCMGLDHALQHRADEFVERRGRMFDERGLHDAIDLLHMALMQCCEDRVFVRKVLIDRTDADPCHLSDAIGGNGIEALALQHSDHRIEDCIDGLVGTTLFWLAAARVWFCFHCRGILSPLESEQISTFCWKVMILQAIVAFQKASLHEGIALIGLKK